MSNLRFFRVLIAFTVIAFGSFSGFASGAYYLCNTATCPKTGYTCPSSCPVQLSNGNKCPFGTGFSCVSSSGGGGGGSSGGSTANSANSVLCNLYSAYYTVQTAIFVIGILLMILGGALYAGSHVMPGQSKGTMQGYAMGMIMGGIIGVVIAVIAPYIFGLIVGNSAILSSIGSGNPYAGYC